MALEESPREDLLREATALVERIELVSKLVTGNSSPDGRSNQPVVAGFRSNGALSIFFGDDEVYHFNAAGEFRRAYRDGQLYKALRGGLVTLTRVELLSKSSYEVVRWVLRNKRNSFQLRDTDWLLSLLTWRQESSK